MSSDVHMRLVDAAKRGLRRIAREEVAPYQAAVLRIGIASVFVAFLIREFPNRHELWGDRSPWTPELAHRFSDLDSGLTLLLLSDSRWWFEFVYLSTIIFGVLLALGWHTRICVVLFTIGMVSIQFRSELMTDGGDNVL